MGRLLARMTVDQNADTSVARSRALPGKTVELGRDRPLRLDCGVELGPFTVAYPTYGRQNRDP